MATERTETAAGGGFVRWVLHESNSLYVRASVLVAVAQLVTSALADILGRETLSEAARSAAGAAQRWLPVGTHVFQVVMILILLAVLMCKRPAGLAPSVRDRAHLLDLQERFSVHWTRVWILWLLLYLGLFAFAFLKQVEIDTLARKLPKHITQQYVWFNRMHEEEDIKRFSETLAIGFEDIKRSIADEALGTGRIDRAAADRTTRPEWSRRALGIHDLPYLVRDDKQVEILKNIIYYVTAREQHHGAAGGGHVPPAAAGELGDRLPEYLNRVGMVDRLTTTLKIERTLTNMINNMQTWQLFVCYLALRPKRNARFPYEIGVTLVGIIAVVETTLISTGVGGSTALQAFRTLSAMAGGVVYALFVGRLESHAMRAPLGLIVALYTYAILQMGWGIEPTSAFAVVVNSLLFFSFAVFKILLFLFVLWLLQSGMLLYYFQYRLHAEQTLDHSTSTFLRSVVPPESARPCGRGA